MDLTSSSYHPVRSSPGYPPSLYDTSTSTVDSYGSASSGMKGRQLHLHPPTHESPRHPANEHGDDKSNPAHHLPSLTPHNHKQLHHLHSRTSKKTSSPSYGGELRATMSEPGVSTEYERYMKERYSSPSQIRLARPQVPASEAGSPSVSAQVRRYDRKHSNDGEHRDDRRPPEQRQQRHPVEPQHSRNSHIPASTSSRPSRITPPKEDRVLQVREAHSPARQGMQVERHIWHLESGAANRAPTRGSTLVSTRRGSFDGTRQKTSPNSTVLSSTPPHPATPKGLDESFDSNVETPSITSVKDLKRQLWNDQEILQVKSSHGGETHVQPGAKEISKTVPRGRSQSQSPAVRRPRSNSTLDHDDSANNNKFNSKYYAAALAAQGHGGGGGGSIASQQYHPDDEEPTRRTSQRNRMDSRETQVTAYSSPYDEGGRSRRTNRSISTERSSSRIRGRVPVVEKQSAPNTSQEAPTENIPSTSSAFQQRSRSSRSAPRQDQLSRSSSGRHIIYETRASPVPQDETNSKVIARLDQPTLTRLKSSQHVHEARNSMERQEESNRKVPIHQEQLSNRGRQLSEVHNADEPREESRTRDQRVLNQSRHRRSPSVQQQREPNAEPKSIVSKEPRGRSPSRFVQQRVREFSQEPKPRTAIHSGGSNVRSFSQGTRSRKNSESSFERLAREFSGELNHLNKSTVKPISQASTQYDSRREGSMPAQGSSDSPPKVTAAVPQVPKKQPSLDSAPATVPSLPDRSNPTSSLPSSTRSESLSQPRSDVAAIWQDMAISSAICPMPDPPFSLQNCTKTDTKATETAKPISNVEMDNHSQPAKPQIQEEPKSPGEKQKVANLVAMLSAVNRSNPEEALAQIDSILRQQGHGKSDEHRKLQNDPSDGNNEVRESPTPFDEPGSGDHSDDDTSVSSMTNPTYQGDVTGHDHMIPNYSKEPLGLEPIARVPSPFGPSTSTFRRPRPSALQNYIPANLQPGKIPAIMSDSPRPMYTEILPRATLQERLGQQMQTSPPTTINVKDKNRSSPVSDTEEQKSVKLADTEPDGWSTPAFKDPKSIAPRKLDKFIANKEALAAKIRVWDDMSQGLTMSKSESSNKHQQQQAGEEKKANGNHRILPTAPKTETRRLHPWDSEVPARLEKLDVRDTSMENADGVEAAMTLRDNINNNLLDDAVQQSMDMSIAEDNSFAPVASEPVHNADESGPNASSFFPAHRQASGWEVAPRMTPEQHMNAHKISSAFDATWASMPTNEIYDEHAITAFGRPDPSSAHKTQALQTSTTHHTIEDGRRGVGPVDLDESLDTITSSHHTRQPPTLPAWADDRLLAKNDEERGAIEVSLLSEEEAMYFDTSAESSSELLNGTQANGSNIQQEGKPKRRGFLRAFMRKEKKKNASRGSYAHESNNSISQASSGAHSLPISDARNKPQIRTIPFTAGMHIEEMPPPTSRGRNRKNSRQRSRSVSLERFRSSAMAEKFSRVMKLYDQD